MLLEDILMFFLVGEGMCLCFMELMIIRNRWRERESQENLSCWHALIFMMSQIANITSRSKIVTHLSNELSYYCLTLVIFWKLET